MKASSRMEALFVSMCIATLLTFVSSLPSSAQMRIAGTSHAAAVHDGIVDDNGALSSHHVATLEKLGKTISLQMDKASLEEVLQAVADQIDVSLIYADWDVLRQKKVSLNEREMTALAVLYKSVEGTGLGFKIAPGGYLLITKDSAGPVSRADSREGPPPFLVSGTVTSLDDGEPIPGVNVVVKGTAIGTVSDNDGAYSIDAPSDQDTLIFSFVGYITAEVPIAGRSRIDIPMEVSEEELDEVIVIGFGEKSRRLMTESIGSIGSDEIRKVPVASPDQALAGRVAGVAVKQTGGAPGNPVSVRVRGIGTTGTAQPLYVVDGVPVGNGYNAVGGGGARNASPLNTLNPADIESISVLKDASAAAVYGVRAANGVVLITTKRGARGNPRVNIEASAGVQNLLDRYDFLGTSDYVALLQEAYNNFNTQSGLSPDDPNYLNLPVDLQPGSPFLSIDNSEAWGDEFINENAPIQEYNLSVSGANDQLNYYVSGSYFNQEAATINYGLERFSFRANSDFNIGDRLRIGESFTIGHTIQQWGLNFSNFGGATGMPPFFSIYDANNEIPNNRYGFHGNRNRAGLTVDNPILPATLDNNTLPNTRLNGVLYGELELLTGLNFRSQAAVDVNYGKSLLIDTQTTAEELGRATSDRTQIGITESFTKVFTNTLTYDTSIRDHSVTALGGFEYQYLSNESVGGRGEDFLSQVRAFRRNAGGGQTLAFNSGLGERAYVGWFGRLSYNFNNKYLLTGTIRRDGSSIFNPEGDRQWGTFPSVSGAWRISEESFFNVAGIDELKVRGSWGQLGNDETLPYGYIFLVSTTPDYTLNGDETVQGPVPQSFVNEDVTWETVETWDAGIDITLLNDRLDILGTFYRRLTRDFLIQIPIPALTGFVIGEGTTTAPVNAGTVLNSGFEFDVQYRTSVGQNLDLQFGANLTTINNELQELTDGIEEFLNVGGFRTAVGEPIAYMYGYETDGLYQNEAEAAAALPDIVNGGRQPQPGDVRFVDIDGDGEITPDDRTNLGKPVPDAYYGFTVSANYNNFDISLFLQGAFGHHMQNRFAQARLNFTQINGDNRLTDITDRWTPQNTDTDIPRLVATDPNDNWRLSDLIVQPADFLRLRNIQIGYTLPQSVTSGIARSARVYLNASNVFLWTKYDGLDPEVIDGRTQASPTGTDFDQIRGGNAFDQGFLPTPRTFQIGIQLQF